MSSTLETRKVLTDADLARILADSVDYVDFHLKVDSMLSDRPDDREKMSQKKCRFCC